MADVMDFPDLIYEKVLGFLDTRNLKNFSVCSKRFFMLTKPLIEKRCTVQVLPEEESSNQSKNKKFKCRKFLRKYNSIEVFMIDSSMVANLKKIVQFYGNGLERLSICFGEIHVNELLEAITMSASIKALSLKMVTVVAGKRYNGPKRIKSDLEELHLFAAFKFPFKAFISCRSLKALTCDSYTDMSAERTSLEDLIAQQTCLKSLNMNGHMKFTDVLSQKTNLELDQLNFIWNVDDDMDSWFEFLPGLNKVQHLSIKITDNYGSASDEEPDEYLKAVLNYIFQLKDLKYLNFDHDKCGKLFVRSKVLKKAKENQNLKHLSMGRITGFMGKILETFLKMYSCMERLEFKIGKKFPSEIIHINKLSALQHIGIEKCCDPDFDLSCVKLGDKLKSFSYAGVDIKLNEWKTFFQNHTALRNVRIVIPDPLEKPLDFINTLLELKDLRTLHLHLKNISESLEGVIRSKLDSNLKYLCELVIAEDSQDASDESESEEEDESEDTDSDDFSDNHLFELYGKLMAL